jgi:O-antigen ligase
MPDHSATLVFQQPLEPVGLVRYLPSVKVTPVVRLAFYLYVATIPFETVDLGVPVEITMISLGLLILTLVFQVPLVIRKPPIAFLCFVFYAAVFAVPVLTRATVYQDEALWQLGVLVQLLLMSWIVFNLMKSEKVARTAIMTFAVSCSILAILQIAGVSETTTNYEESIQRTTSFGFHPNNLARILSLALLILVGLAYGGAKNPLTSKAIIWPLYAIIGFAVIETGSRGALLAFMAGLSFIVLRRGSLKTKVRNTVVLVMGAALIALIAFESELFRSRFERAMDDGDLARREQIYPAAWDMFLERPLTGWGGKGSEFELGTRLAHEDETSKNPHNLVLYVLVATGLLGAIPLMAGIALAGRAAWRARNGPRGVVPISLVAAVFVANMSGLWLHNKMHWFVMAFALSSTSVLTVRKVSRPEILLPDSAGPLIKNNA